MKLFLQLLLLISTFPINANAFKLKSGDLILQSNACYLCSLIEAEEKSRYSHMGILIATKGHWSVLESWGYVKLSSLNEFIGRRRNKTKTLILRMNDEFSKTPLDSNTMLQRFENHYAGLSYDSQFLWNNTNVNGEKLYCSEFVAKFMQTFLIISIPTKPMHFEANRKLWLDYFHGNPPDGAPGISPGDFERSPFFRHVGMI